MLGCRVALHASDGLVIGRFDPSFHIHNLNSYKILQDSEKLGHEANNFTS